MTTATKGRFCPHSIKPLFCQENAGCQECEVYRNSFPRTCSDCHQPKYNTRYNTEHVGGVGDVVVYTCEPCLEKRRRESDEACRLLREAIRKEVSSTRGKAETAGRKTE